MARQLGNFIVVILIGTCYPLFRPILPQSQPTTTADCIQKTANAPNCTLEFRYVGLYSAYNATCIGPNTFVLPVSKLSPNASFDDTGLSSLFRQSFARITCQSPIDGVEFEFKGTGTIELFRIWKRERGTVTKLYQTYVEVLLSQEATGNYNLFYNAPNATSSNFTFFIFVEGPTKPYLIGSKTHTLKGAPLEGRNESILLPCVTSNQNVSIHLFKKISPEHLWIQIQPEQIQRDLKRGLIVNKTSGSETYRCTTGQDELSPDSLTVVVEGPFTGQGQEKRADSAKDFILAVNGGTITCRSNRSAANDASEHPLPHLHLPLLMTVFYTQNPTESLILQNCLESGNFYCGSHSYNHPLVSEFTSASSSPSAGSDACVSPMCARVENAHREGLIYCTDQLGGRITQDYFTGLDGNIYMGWKEAPSHALISPKWTPNASVILTTGIEYFAYCDVASHFFTRQSYLLSMKFKNGSVIPFGQAEYTWGMFKKSFFAITEVEEIICSDNLWSSNQVVNSTIKLTVVEGPCPSDGFKCDNGQCLKYYRWVCDGDSDCRDGSDELNCRNHTCKQPGHFQCLSGKCLPIAEQCNNVVGCPGGAAEDESLETCQNTTCGPDQFKCGTGQCVSLTSVCNGYSNCLDGSDEYATSCRDVPCPAGQYRCENVLSSVKQCISAAYICDGDRDCSEGSDERNCSVHAPVIENTVHGVTFLPNTMNELICSVSLSRPDHFYGRVHNMSWLHNGWNITDDSRIWRDRSGQKWALKFPNVTIRDEGEYTCQVFNRYGRGSHKINVTIQADTTCTRDLGYHICLLRKCHFLDNECITELEYERIQERLKTSTSTSTSKTTTAPTSPADTDNSASRLDLAEDGGGSSSGSAGASSGAGFTIGMILLAFVLIGLITGGAVFAYKYYTRVPYNYPRSRGRRLSLDAQSQNSSF